MNKETGIRSDIYIDKDGILCEVVAFGEEKIEYRINGITEHIIFGVYFSFNQKNIL